MCQASGEAGRPLMIDVTGYFDPAGVRCMSPCVVVGIAGGSASGKSTLTSALAAALQRIHQRRVFVLTTDRYMQADRSRGPSFYSPTAGTHMFDANHPDAIVWSQVLHDLD